MNLADLMIWNSPQLWSERSREKGIPDMFLFYLDHAEETRNFDYLENVAAGLPADEDPFGRLASEAQAILQRLRGN